MRKEHGSLKYQITINYNILIWKTAFRYQHIVRRSTAFETQQMDCLF